MVTLGLKCAIGCLAVTPGIDHKRLRQFPGDLSACATFYKVHTQIPPSHATTCTGNVAIYCYELFGVQIYLRVALAKPVTEAPVGGGLFIVEQARLSQQKSPGAVTR